MVFLFFLLVKKKKKEKKKKKLWLTASFNVRVYLYIISHGEKQMTIGSKGVVEIYIK